LAVIPPKDLPRVMRTVGQTVGKMRRMAAEFQGQFMDAMREVEREADLESVKKEFQAINEQARVDAAFDPVSIVRDDVTKAAQAADESLKREADAPDIGKSEIALTGPQPAEIPAPRTEAEPEADPAAVPRRSAAE
jgi:sec-independent protein translocase protein TatB